MFGSALGILLSGSSFVSGEVVLRGFHVYGAQARAASICMFILCVYGFWQLYGKFLVKDEKLKLIVIIFEMVIGAVLVAYLNINVEAWNKNLQLALVISISTVLTDKLWKGEPESGTRRANQQR